MAEPRVIQIEVVNDSDRVIRVSSHYPFWRADWQLRFDRAQAQGCRLNTPDGTVTAFEPHAARVVELVREQEDERVQKRA